MTNTDKEQKIDELESLYIYNANLTRVLYEICSQENAKDNRLDSVCDDLVLCMAQYTSNLTAIIRRDKYLKAHKDLKDFNIQ